MADEQRYNQSDRRMETRNFASGILSGSLLKSFFNSNIDCLYRQLSAPELRSSKQDRKGMAKDLFEKEYCVHCSCYLLDYYTNNRSKWTKSTLLEHGDISC